MDLEVGLCLRMWHWDSERLLFVTSEVQMQTTMNLETVWASTGCFWDAGNLRFVVYQSPGAEFLDFVKCIVFRNVLAVWLTVLVFSVGQASICGSCFSCHGRVSADSTRSCQSTGGMAASSEITPKNAMRRTFKTTMIPTTYEQAGHYRQCNRCIWRLSAWDVP